MDLNRTACFFCAVVFLTGCDSFTQINRDNLRYATAMRGTEIYEVSKENIPGGNPTKTDSLHAGVTASNHEIDFYSKYMYLYAQFLRNEVPRLPNVLKQEAGTPSTAGTSGTAGSSQITVKTPEPEGNVLNIARQSQPYLIPPPATDIGGQKIVRASTVEREFGTWGDNNFSTTTKTVFGEDGKTIKEKIESKSLHDVLARSMSSIASINQMRDLLTEPSFPKMLPMRREINLGCLAPAENVVFQSMSALQAAFEKGSVQASVSVESRNEAFKAVQETQKTWFLQNAMFRLCEMAVNAPAGFRNVYPVIIHDIVRRTAEMQEQDEASIAKRVAAEEASVQERFKAEAAKHNEKAKEIELATVQKEIELVQAKKSFADVEHARLAERIDKERELAEAKCLAASAEKAHTDAEIASAKERCAKLKAL